MSKTMTVDARTHDLARRGLCDMYSWTVTALDTIARCPDTPPHTADFARAEAAKARETIRTARTY